MRRLLCVLAAVGDPGQAPRRGPRATGPEPGWSGTAELTVVFTGGNAEAQTLGFKNDLVRVWEEANLTVALGALRAESSTITRLAQGSPTDFAVSRRSVQRADGRELLCARAVRPRADRRHVLVRRRAAGSATRLPASRTASPGAAVSGTRGWTPSRRCSRRRTV